MQDREIIWIDYWEGKKTVTRYLVAETRCKYRGSPEHVVKFGRYKGVQRWWCNKCQRKFTTADTLPKMKTPIRHRTKYNDHFLGLRIKAIFDNRAHFSESGRILDSLAR